MSCFGLAWLMNLLIWLVVLGAVVAIVRVLLPLVLSNLGAAGSIHPAKVLTIVMWAVVVIAIIYFAFEMISCLLSSGVGLRLGR
jgi:hypothetical protein